MNILLIFPLNEPFGAIVSAADTPWSAKLSREKNIKRIDCVYPTGLLSIGAYLTKHIPDVAVKILDLNAVLKQKAARGQKLSGYRVEDFIEEAFSLLNGFTPDLVGVSALFCSAYPDLKPLVSFLRKNHPESFIACGGHLASALYTRFFADLAIDAVAYGEGEIPLVELVAACLAGEKEEYLASSSLWITSEKLTRHDFKPRNDLIMDLDEIPPFDLNMLVLPEAYFDVAWLFIMEPPKDQREMMLFSTRGCPYRCVFCASQNVHGRKVRCHSVERIKSDIAYYREKYNISKFVFVDDHFLIQKQRALEIMNFITAQNLTAEMTNLAFFAIDTEIAAALKRIGMKEVNITIESGNENTLRNIIRKPGTLKKAAEAVDALHAAGILVVSNILIGFPGETKESIEASVQYLLKTNINWFQCYVAAPLPGSELYRICEEGHYLAGGNALPMDFKKGVICTPDFTPEYIEKKVYEMNLTLNFVHNYDFRSGNYATALMLFERVLTSIIDTHAFAYYFAAKCCAKLGLDEKYLTYKSRYQEMVSKFPFWREYAEQFELEALP